MNDAFWMEHIRGWMRMEHRQRPCRLVCLVEDEGEFDTIRTMAEGLGVGAVSVYDDSWTMNPTSHAIIVGTHDELLSRSLDRGYGVKPAMWHIQFGLLNSDCLWTMKSPNRVWCGLDSLHKKLGAYNIFSDTKVTDAADIPIRGLFDVSGGTEDDIEEFMMGFPHHETEQHERMVQGTKWVTLPRHLSQTVTAVLDLAVNKRFEGTLLTAARYHDYGKSHPLFQKMLLGGLDQNERMSRAGTVWAKRRPRTRLECAGYRHDLTGACAFVSTNPDMLLEGYLIMSHHGRFYFSIPKVSDRLPKTDVGGGIIVGDTSFEMTQDKWGAIFDQLYRTHGPFVLAYLEAVLRVADMRASDL